MRMKWCTDIVADWPNWKQACNKQKVMKSKRWKEYSFSSGDYSQQIFLYQVYCTKSNKVFNEDDFIGSVCQLEKMKKYLRGDSFKFCRSFILMVEQKTLMDGRNNPPAARVCPEVNTDNEDGISESDTSTFLPVSSPQFVSEGEEGSGRDDSLQLSSSSPSTMAPR